MGWCYFLSVKFATSRLSLLIVKCQILMGSISRVESKFNPLTYLFFQDEDHIDWNKFKNPGETAINQVGGPPPSTSSGTTTPRRFSL